MTLNERIELSRARTPLYLASISGSVGGLVVLASLFNPLSDAKFATIVNFSTTIISTGLAGAAGVAQGQKSTTKIDNIQNAEEIK